MERYDLPQFEVYGLDFKTSNNKLFIKPRFTKSGTPGRQWSNITTQRAIRILEYATDNDISQLLYTDEELKQQEQQREHKRPEREHKRPEREHKRPEQKYPEFDALIDKGAFNEIVNRVINENKTLTKEQTQTLWNKIREQGKHTMRLTTNMETKNVMLNDTTKDYFTSLLMNGTEFIPVETFGSDAIADFNFIDLREITIAKLPEPDRVIKNKDGKFFAYINASGIDLSELQIFTQAQADDKDMVEGRDHCLTHTLACCGVSKELINRVKMAFSQNCNIRKCDLKQVADIIYCNIILHYFNSKDTSNKIYKQTINAEESRGTIYIALYENHYFIFKTTIYSKYCITYYKALRHEPNFNNIVRFRRQGVTYATDRKISSLRLVHKFFLQGYFRKMNLTRFAEASKHKELKNHIYLGIDLKDEQRKAIRNFESDPHETTIDTSHILESDTEEDSVIEEEDSVIEEEEEDLEEEKLNATPDNLYFADCESYVNGDYHTLQLLGCVGSTADEVVIFSVTDEVKIEEVNQVSQEQLVVYRWLNHITKNGETDATCYFHNLKYDYHLLEPYIFIKRKCEKDNSLYSVKLAFKGKKIMLLDSFKMIPFALAKFQSNFDLPPEFSKKEAIAYTYYTKENDNVRIKTKDYKKLLSLNEQEIFVNQIQDCPSYDEKTDTFNPMTYYKEYLRIDCLVLKKGMQKFNELIRDITNGKLSIYGSLTISSLTDNYMKKEGAYDDVYEVKGNLRAYIAQAVYGGRVAVNEKYEKQVIEQKIEDFDGVSLYPSAIDRLCTGIGLPKGKAKRFNKNRFDWEKKTYSILTIKILEVCKNQQIPFIAQKNDGSILYLNTPPKGKNGRFKEIVIDSITLEDYIKFHKIQYEILDGVYWNSGGNKKMGKVIRRLFDKRLTYKKSNPALANVIKLMLNSSYGKTIMKKATTHKKIISASKKNYNKKTGVWTKRKNDKFDSYIYNNFNTIKSYRALNDDCYEVEKICADNSYNRGHIGCAILSTSKRIMNEVFDIANTKGFNIYYTDTDSIHCDSKDINGLNEEYLSIYKKQLIGKQLGQFHSDFDLKGAAGPVYAIQSIFLGKKSYIDHLESIDKDGNIIHGYHKRLKGITEAGLEDAAKIYNTGPLLKNQTREPEYFKLYTELATGASKNILLNPHNADTNKNKVLFEFKQGRVSTRREFYRKVQF